ncbi:MAG TPA: DUF371 domain-containing protein [Nitrososphaerales archaeon]|nr:DUF371 domain-containing protein [Nitrososphaerales archaeon]
MALSQRANAVVTFHGHPLVRSAHPTTIEVTTEDHLTSKGDCILGVGASSGCAQLDARVKAGLRTKGSRVTIRLAVGNHAFEVRAEGDPRLELSHPKDIVIRRSDFVSDRTLAVHADAAAKDVPREMVRLLRDPCTLGRLEIEVAKG